MRLNRNRAIMGSNVCCLGDNFIIFSELSTFDWISFFNFNFQRNNKVSPTTDPSTRLKFSNQITRFIEYTLQDVYTFFKTSVRN